MTTVMTITVLPSRHMSMQWEVHECIEGCANCYMCHQKPWFKHAGSARDVFQAGQCSLVHGHGIRASHIPKLALCGPACRPWECYSMRSMGMPAVMGTHDVFRHLFNGRVAGWRSSTGFFTMSDLSRSSWSPCWNGIVFLATIIFPFFTSSMLAWSSSALSVVFIIQNGTGTLGGSRKTPWSFLGNHGWNNWYMDIVHKCDILCHKSSI